MAYLQSSQVKMFPSAYRSQEVDPESFYTTEGNLTKSSALGFNYTSFVTNNGKSLTIVIDGYRFDVNQDNIKALFTPSEGASYPEAIYAYIKVANKGTNNTFRTLVSYADGSSTNLDDTSSPKKFVGLSFDSSSQQQLGLQVLEWDSESNDYRVYNPSRAIIDSRQIRDVGDNDYEASINEIFTGNKAIFSDDVSIGGDVSITSNTTSSSKTTGALKVTGGVGIGNNLNVGGDVEVEGDLTIDGVSNFKDYVNVVDSGVGLDNSNLTLSESSFEVKDSNDSTMFSIDDTTGDTYINGELDVGSTLEVNGATFIYNDLTITNESDTDVFTVDGTSGNTFIYGDLEVQSDKDTTTGSLVSTTLDSQNGHALRVKHKIGTTTTATASELDMNANGLSLASSKYSSTSTSASKTDYWSISKDGNLKVESIEASEYSVLNSNNYCGNLGSCVTAADGNPKVVSSLEDFDKTKDGLHFFVRFSNTNSYHAPSMMITDDEQNSIVTAPLYLSYYTSSISQVVDKEPHNSWNKGDIVEVVYYKSPARFIVVGTRTTTVPFATCSTGSENQDKVIIANGYSSSDTGLSGIATNGYMPNFVVSEGAHLYVYFTNGNTYLPTNNSARLKFNGAAYSIAYPANWNNDSLVEFVYHGGSFRIVNIPDTLTTQLGYYNTGKFQVPFSYGQMGGSASSSGVLNTTSAEFALNTEFTYEPYNSRLYAPQVQTGNVIFSYASNAATMQLYDSNNVLYLYSSSYDGIMIKVDPANSQFNCYLKGYFGSSVDASSYNARSDERLKENIVSYTCDNSILDLDVKEFDYKKDGSHHIGCIAQDLQKICPEIVHEDKDGYLTIEENKIVYLLLEEVKKLRKEVDELKNR